MSPINLAYLSLGSNIDPERNLPRAVALLREAGEVRAVSSVYETEPQGRTDQPRFLNAAVLLATELDRAEVKRDVIARIEKALGRVRDPRDKNAPRTIDIDVSIWVPGGGAGQPNGGGRQAGAPAASGPDASGAAFDADILRWAHVAVPLAEIAPDTVHPADGRALSSIASELAARGTAPCLRREVRL